MIRIFSGEDTYESYNLAKKQAYKFSADLNLEVKIINADDISDPTEFIQYLEGVGMFSSGYIVFLKRLSQNKKLLDYFTQNYESIQNYTIIIWEDKKIDSRLKFFQIAKKDDLVINCDLPKDSNLRIWINEKLKESKIKLLPEQISELIVNIGPDKWRLINEIEKISIYLNLKKQQNPTQEEFSRVVGYDIEGDIWKLVDAFSNRDKKGCIRELDKMLKIENNSQYIIAMLERELTLLSQIVYSTKYKVAQTELNMHPFVLQKLKAKSQNFSFNELSHFLKKLFDLDYAIKKGNIEEKIGLSLYILSI